MQLMSVKKQNSSFCKLFSFYEEKTKNFVDGTDINNFFFTKTFTIIPSPGVDWHELAKAPREDPFVAKMLPLRLEDTAAFHPPRWSEHFQKQWTWLSARQDAQISKTAVQTRKNLRIPLTTPKIAIGSKKSKDNLITHFKYIIEISERQIVYGSVWATTILASLLWKMSSNTVTWSHLQKLSNLNIAKSTTLT